MTENDPLSAPSTRGESPVPAPAERAGEDFPLHGRVHEWWGWQARFSGATVTAISLVPATVFALVDHSWRPLAFIATLGLLAGFVVWRVTLAYHHRYARTFSCRLLADGLLVARGVWWRQQLFVPRARVQHTDVSDGPMSRHFGIASLVVFTAGTAESQVKVEGLSREHALALRDRLLGREGHDAV